MAFLSAIAVAGLLASSCGVANPLAPDLSADEAAFVVPEKNRTFVVFGDPQQLPVIEWVTSGGPSPTAAPDPTWPIPRASI
ncbi:MAG: hypothetical protein AAB215_01835, partial [Planctomycetota bacterium]